MLAGGVEPDGWIADARRYFFDLHKATGSDVADQALVIIRELYNIERDCKDLDTQAR